MNTIKPKYSLGSAAYADQQTAAYSVQGQQIANQAVYQVSNIAMAAPTSGIFDWIGGQDNGVNSGFHISDNDLKAGDIVRVKALSDKYSGDFVIKYMGADDGTYQNSMMTIGIPKVAGENTSGTWTLLARASSAQQAVTPVQQVPSNPVQQVPGYPADQVLQPVQESDNKGISPTLLIGGLLVLTVVGVIGVKSLG